jgi:DNA-3-methyladenine glycosylase II
VCAVSGEHAEERMAAKVTIKVDGPFSLAAAAGFGFGPNMGRPFPDDVMRLAFVADDLRHQTGVVLAQSPDGSLTAEISGDADPAAAQDQIRRVLSLDADPAGWLAAGRSDPVLGRVQTSLPGLRPVLFHSPYEAAAWAILAQRRHRSQAIADRRRLSVAAGVTFELAGQEEPAFPLPERILEITSAADIDETRLSRLHSVAQAALDGQLEPARLAAMPPDEALAALQRIKGLGPFYATLVYLRSTGVKDAAALGEPRLASYLRHYYGLAATPDTDEVRRLAESWRPFRTWAAVLFRAAGDRDGLPFEDRPSRR